MIAVGQVWQAKNSSEQIKIIDINNKIVVAKSLTSGQQFFFTEFSISETYRPITTTTDKSQAIVNTP